MVTYKTDEELRQVFDLIDKASEPSVSRRLRRLDTR